MKKLDASKMQLNMEKFLISFESLKLPNATKRMRKTVSKLELVAKCAKLFTMFVLASLKFDISNALFKIILHFFKSIMTNVYNTMSLQLNRNNQNKKH